MLKKIALSVVCAMIASVWLCGYELNPAFKSLLQNNGTMDKNTLKITSLSNDGVDGAISLNASGELVATGVLVRDASDTTIFYPDSNLKNVLFDEDSISKCMKGANKATCKSIKPTTSYAIAAQNPAAIKKAFGTKIFGQQAMRAKVTFSGQTIDHEPYINQLNIKSIFPLTPEKKIYQNSQDYRYLEFQYNSKDDYVNIRQTPKGAIAGQIMRADMQKPEAQRGIIACLYAQEELGDGECKEENGWYEIFYFPAGKRDGKDAIHGYVHKSQIKLPY